MLPVSTGETIAFRGPRGQRVAGAAGVLPVHLGGTRERPLPPGRTSAALSRLRRKPPRNPSLPVPYADRRPPPNSLYQNFYICGITIAIHSTLREWRPLSCHLSSVLLHSALSLFCKYRFPPSGFHRDTNSVVTRSLGTRGGGGAGGRVDRPGYPRPTRVRASHGPANTKVKPRPAALSVA